MFKILHNSFSKSLSLGLDISDNSIKYIELIKTKSGIAVKRCGEKKIPAGIIKSGKIKDQKWLEQILILLRKKEGIDSANISLPYELLDKDEQNFGIEIDSMLGNIIEEYLSIFKSSMISTESIEFEANAIAKSVIKKDDSDTYMIVDFGKKRTGIFIVSNGRLMFTSVLDFGGEKLTKMIKESLNVSFEEAEKLKWKHGLKRNTKNMKLSEIISDGFSILCDEIKKHYVYWHLHKDDGERKKIPIKKIILCGSESNINGLTEYLSVAMRHKVELANVWTNVLNTEKLIPEISFEESFNFAGALGMALNGFNKGRN
jgi:Tfp pilus assembly PilM family ATPase